MRGLYWLAASFDERGLTRCTISLVLEGGELGEGEHEYISRSALLELEP